MSSKLILPSNNALIVCVDEAGRGPLIHDVVAGCVIMPSEYDEHDIMVGQIKDSKKCTKNLMLKLEDYIKNTALAWAVGKASVEEIDKHNILNATMIAMHRALDNIHEQIAFEQILVDGNRFKTYLTPTNAEFIPHNCIIDGDAKYLGIAAASIIAKVERDRLIDEIVAKYPEYEERYKWSSNKGYGTKDHLDGLIKYGPTKFHRMSFKPVKEVAKLHAFKI